MAPKRGKRLGWKDEKGESTTQKYIAHSEHGICWRDATSEEISAIPKKDSKGAKKVDLVDQIKQAKAIALEKAWIKHELKEEIMQKVGVKYSRVQREIFPALRDDPDIIEKTGHVGKSPTHFIGPKADVLKAIEDLSKLF